MNFQEFLSTNAAQNDFIHVPKIFIDMVSDLNAGITLSEIAYWYKPGINGISKLRVHRNGFFWIAVARHDWWYRTRMSPKQIDRALGILESQGLIVKELLRFNGSPTTHVRLIEEPFMALWNQFVEVEVKNPFLPKVEIEIDQRDNSTSPEPEEPGTETTSETTTANAGTSTVPAAPADAFRRRIQNPGSGVASDRDGAEKKKLSPADPNFPKTGQLVLQIIGRNKSQTRNLTEKQCEDLRAAVNLVGITTTYPSPEEEFEAFPEQFTRFANQIEQMAWWKHNAINAGNVIKALRNYSWDHGWFMFRPGNSGITVDYSQDEAPDGGVQAYMKRAIQEARDRGEG